MDNVAALEGVRDSAPNRLVTVRRSLGARPWDRHRNLLPMPHHPMSTDSLDNAALPASAASRRGSQQLGSVETEERAAVQAGAVRATAYVDRRPLRVLTDVWGVGAFPASAVGVAAELGVGLGRTLVSFGVDWGGL